MCGNLRNLDCPFERVNLYRKKHFWYYIGLDFSDPKIISESLKGIVFVYSDLTEHLSPYLKKYFDEEVVDCPWFRKSIFLKDLILQFLLIR